MASWNESLRDKRILSAGEAFAERLLQVRAKQNVTQDDLAQALDRLGRGNLSRQVIGKIERGGTRARNVSLEDVLSIAWALGVPPVQLMVSHDMEARMRIVASERPLVCAVAADWIAGGFSPPGTDPKTYYLELPPEELVAVVAEAREVAIGERSSSAAFFMRQRMTERGEAPPVVPREEEEHGKSSS